jgi:ribulose-bisphosphate carboxylase large chain
MRALSLPVMTHPAFLGPYVLSHRYRVRPWRDVRHAPAPGRVRHLGLSQRRRALRLFTPEDCRDDRRSACRTTRGGLGRPILPSSRRRHGPRARPRHSRAIYGPDAVHPARRLAFCATAERIGEAVADLLVALDRPA